MSDTYVQNVSDPHTPRRISATVKFPETDRYKGDNPWLVFEGSSPAEVRAQLIEAFGMDAEATEGMTLHEVLVEAEDIFVTISTAKRGLGGGQVLSKGKGKSSGNAWDKVGSGESAAPEAAEPEENPLVTAINNSKTVEELKQLWAENQEAFADTELMDQWKAKGKSLQSA